jgi:hypothetical protein
VNLHGDGANCGACGHSCLGGACSVAACQPVVLATLSKPSDLEVDDTSLYVALGALSTIKRLDKVSGASQQTSFTEGTILMLAQDPANLYALSTNSGLFDIDRQAKSTFPKSQSIAGEYSAISGVAAADGNVYFSFDHYINVVAQSFYYAAPTGHAPLVIAADGKGLVWAERAGNIVTLMASDLTFYGVHAIAQPTMQFVTQPVLDATNVYWHDGNNGVYASRRDGGGYVQLGTAPSVFTPMVVDGGYLYWTEPNGSGAVRRVPTTGGPTTMVSAVCTANGLAIDATAIYWSCSDTGQIMRVAK